MSPACCKLSGCREDVNVAIGGRPKAFNHQVFKFLQARGAQLDDSASVYNREQFTLAGCLL